MQLALLPLERNSDYEERFGQKQFHERGRLGDRMGQNGSIVDVNIFTRQSTERTSLRLKSKQSPTSNQVLEAIRLLIYM